jgi:Flp pilus assembly protein TadG
MVVEFSLVILWFLTLIFGAIELGRWLYGIDAAQSAAQEAARAAVVCGLGATGPTKRAQSLTTMLTGGTTTIAYVPNGCCASQTACATACKGVEVRMVDYEVPSFLGIFPDMAVPNVTTYLTRESMDSTDNAAICTG